MQGQHKYSSMSRPTQIINVNCNISSKILENKDTQTGTCGLFMFVHTVSMHDTITKDE